MGNYYCPAYLIILRTTFTLVPQKSRNLLCNHDGISPLTIYPTAHLFLWCWSCLQDPQLNQKNTLKFHFQMRHKITKYSHLCILFIFRFGDHDYQKIVFCQITKLNLSQIFVFVTCSHKKWSYKQI